MPLTAKMHKSGPAGAHFGPSNITTKSCPVTASIANAMEEKKVSDDSAIAQDRLSSSRSFLSLLRPETAMLCNGSVRMLSRLL